MRKRLFLLCIAGMLVLCSGCGNSASEKKDGTKTNASVESKDTSDNEEENKSTEEKTTETETEDMSLIKPNEERMLKDLEEKQCNTISFSTSGQQTTIDIAKMTLDKAKDEDGAYIAYCTLDLKNDYYEAKVTYSLKYSYYDIGGWQLDEVKEESRSITPLKPDDIIGQERIKYVRKNDRLYEATEVVLSSYEEVLGETNSWKCYYNVTASRNYADVHYVDSVTCHFDENEGWTFGRLSVSFSWTDWNKLIGKKFYTGYKNGKYYYIEVVAFDEIMEEATVKFTAHNDSGWKIYVNGAYEGIFGYDISGECTNNIKMHYGYEEVVEYYFRHDDMGGLYWSEFHHVYSGYNEVKLFFEWDCDYGICYFEDGNSFYADILTETE